MSEPLAILYYSNLMPGGQLANRLQDLGYRVQTMADHGGAWSKLVNEKNRWWSWPKFCRAAPPSPPSPN